MLQEDSDELDDIAVSSLAAAASGKETVLKTRIKSYVESVVPLYSSDDFKSHFRLSRQTAEVQIQRCLTVHWNNNLSSSLTSPSSLLSITPCLFHSRLKTFSKIIPAVDVSHPPNCLPGHRPLPFSRRHRIFLFISIFHFPSSAFMRTLNITLSSSLSSSWNDWTSLFYMSWPYRRTLFNKSLLLEFIQMTVQLIYANYGFPYCTEVWRLVSLLFSSNVKSFKTPSCDPCLKSDSILSWCLVLFLKLVNIPAVWFAVMKIIEHGNWSMASMSISGLVWLYTMYLY